MKTETLPQTAAEAELASLIVSTLNSEVSAAAAFAFFAQSHDSTPKGSAEVISYGWQHNPSAPQADPAVIESLRGIPVSLLSDNMARMTGTIGLARWQAQPSLCGHVLETIWRSIARSTFADRAMY